MKAVFSCGRMNPPTVGHAKVVEEMLKIAAGDPCFLFATRSTDAERNPLPLDAKLSYLHRAFPDVVVEDTLNVFSAAERLAQSGFDEAVLVLGADRASLALEVAQKAARLGLPRITVKLVERHERDASATAARKAAAAGDEGTFAALCAVRDPDYVSDLFHAVRHGMGV